MPEAIKEQEKGLPRDESERMEEARKELRRLEEEIAPFVGQKKLTRISTDGTWRDSTSLLPS